MKKILFTSLAYFLFTSVICFAESVQLKSMHCKAVKQSSSGKWDRVSLSKIPEKTVLKGQRAKTKEIFLFKWDQEVYAISTKCITSIDKTPPTELIEDESPLWKVYPFISLLSWHERVTISASDGRSSQLYSSNIGVCPGVGATRKMSHSFSWDGSICLVYARSDLANSSTTTTSDVLYTTKNSRSYGLKGEIGALFHFENERTSLGLEIPLFYRMSGWPKPTNATYVIKPDPAFHYGLLAVSALEVNRLLFKPKFGYLISTKGLIWSLDFGYLF